MSTPDFPCTSEVCLLWKKHICEEKNLPPGAKTLRTSDRKVIYGPISPFLEGAKVSPITPLPYEEANAYLYNPALIDIQMLLKAQDVPQVTPSKEGFVCQDQVVEIMNVQGWTLPDFLEQVRPSIQGWIDILSQICKTCQELVHRKMYTRVTAFSFLIDYDNPVSAASKVVVYLADFYNTYFKDFVPIAAPFAASLSAAIQEQRAKHEDTESFMLTDLLRDLCEYKMMPWQFRKFIMCSAIGSVTSFTTLLGTLTSRSADIAKGKVPITTWEDLQGMLFQSGWPPKNLIIERLMQFLFEEEPSETDEKKQYRDLFQAMSRAQLVELVTRPECWSEIPVSGSSTRGLQRFKSVANAVYMANVLLLQRSFWEVAFLLHE